MTGSPAGTGGREPEFVDAQADNRRVHALSGGVAGRARLAGGLGV